MPDVSLNDAVAQIKDEIVRLSNNASFKKKLKFYLYTKLLIRPFTAPKVKPVEGTAPPKEKAPDYDTGPSFL